MAINPQAAELALARNATGIMLNAHVWKLIFLSSCKLCLICVRKR